MRGVVLIALLLILCGCSRTVYVPTESIRTEYRTDTIKEVRTLRDSVYHRDSIYFEGETIVKDRWRYKYVTKIDTVYRSKVDTVYQHQERTKLMEVERRPNALERLLTAMGKTFALLIAAGAAFAVWRLKRH